MLILFFPACTLYSYETYKISSERPFFRNKSRFILLNQILLSGKNISYCLLSMAFLNCKMLIVFLEVYRKKEKKLQNLALQGKNSLNTRKTMLIC